MPAAQKRAAEDEPAGRRTRSGKAARTEGAASPRKGGKKGPKTSLGASGFKARALPLHVNITHTPPAVPDEETANATSADPGFIGTSTLVPTAFNTGSYGWKGNKRITIELENRETGEKEKVHVMVTINATVMGSKSAKDEGEGEVEGGEVDGEVAEGSAKKEAEAAVAAEPEAAPTAEAKPQEEVSAAALEAAETEAQEAQAAEKKAETEEKPAEAEQ